MREASVVLSLFAAQLWNTSPLMKLQQRLSKTVSLTYFAKDVQSKLIDIIHKTIFYLLILFRYQSVR